MKKRRRKREGEKEKEKKRRRKRERERKRGREKSLYMTEEGDANHWEKDLGMHRVWIWYMYVCVHAYTG